MEQGNIVFALNPVSLAFPVELLHEPNVEKIWDPLSSPLHTSSLFCDITAGLLGKIFGEVPPREPGERCEASPVNYRFFLAKLKRIHSFAFIDDPKALSESDAAISSILTDPQDRVKSNLISLALKFAVAKAHTRLCEPSSGVTLDEASRAVPSPIFSGPSPAPPFFSESLSPYPNAASHYAFLFAASCTVALGFNPHLWSLPDDASDPDAIYPGVLDDLEEMQRILSDVKKWGFSLDEPPISLHTLEAMKVQAALFNLEPPPGRSENDSLVRFCRGVQDAILRNLHVDQQDVLRAELAARRVNRDGVTSGA